MQAQMLRKESSRSLNQTLVKINTLKRRLLCRLSNMRWAALRSTLPLLLKHFLEEALSDLLFITVVIMQLQQINKYIMASSWSLMDSLSQATFFYILTGGFNICPKTNCMVWIWNQFTNSYRHGSQRQWVWPLMTREKFPSMKAVGLRLTLPWL